jgi:hypothetical protein
MSASITTAELKHRVAAMEDGRWYTVGADLIEPLKEAYQAGVFDCDLTFKDDFSAVKRCTLPDSCNKVIQPETPPVLKNENNPKKNG